MQNVTGLNVNHISRSNMQTTITELSGSFAPHNWDKMITQTNYRIISSSSESFNFPNKHTYILVSKWWHKMIVTVIVWKYYANGMNPEDARIPNNNKQNIDKSTIKKKQK